MKKHPMDEVVFLNPRTCGIYKDGGTRYKTDTETGKRTAEVDNELIEHVNLFLNGKMPDGAKKVPLIRAFENKVLVPTYYDDRYQQGIQKLLKEEGLGGITIGEMIDKGLIKVRGGHGSPSNDQRSGTIPYVKVSDIRALRININPTNLVTESVARRFWRSDQSSLESWDLITPNRASSNIGEFAVLLPGEERIVITKEVFILRVIDNKLFDHFYLLWALSLKAVREQWRRIALMQTNREDCGSRFREIILPKPMNRDWADKISEQFRKYFTTIATAKNTFIEAVMNDKFEHVANVATIMPSDLEIEEIDLPSRIPHLVTEDDSVQLIAPDSSPYLNTSISTFKTGEKHHRALDSRAHLLMIEKKTSKFVETGPISLSATDDSNVDDLLKDPRNVPVWFGTNRAPVNPQDLTQGFSGDWSENTTLGKCIVNVPKGHVPGKTGSAWWIRLVKGDDRLKVISIEPLSDFWNQISKAMREPREKETNEALFFLHGYNVTFEQATIRTAQLAYDLRIQPAVFFSWPSRGQIEDYEPDGTTIEASYDAVTNFVKQLDHYALGAGATLHVVAHSMGNRALLRALEAVAQGMAGGGTTSIDKLVFAAPDVDARVFMQSLKKIAPVGKRKTLYTSHLDRAVWLSKLISMYPRVGFIPPVTIMQGLDTIDATDVDKTFVGHDYFASVRALINDLSSLIKGGLPPTERVGIEVAEAPDGSKYWQIK